MFDGPTMSDVEVQPAMDDEAFLRAGGYRSGKDRRASPRIPLTKPVRVGPPGGLPQSPVSAADLSGGGLFIDADRPVRVGARFSVQIPLATGSSVYVEEAEVVYNRHTASAPGFGVRFLRMNPASQAAIAQEVARLSPKTLPRQPQLPQEELPTLVPAAFGGDVAVNPSVRPPSLIEESLDIGAPSDIGPPDLASRTSALPWYSGSAGWFLRHARTLGLVLASIAAATVLMATVVFLWSSPRKVAREEGPLKAAAVPADTHRALMDATMPVAEVVPPPPAPVVDKPKRRLPELVVVDDEPVSKPKKKRITKPKKRIRRARAPQRKSRRPGPRSVGADRFAFPLPSGARIRKTMVYRKPERVVIDLLGVNSGFEPREVPKGNIKRFRVGRHPRFVRLVLDARRPIKSARASIEGGRLRVAVSYR